MERKRIIELEKASRSELIIKKKNNFVEAGAGAGKTYSLITRIFHQLTRKDNPVEPKEIVAITFTNKAAEELRVRIVGRLKKKEESDVDEASLANRKKELLRSVDQMQISTIHKFCDNILKENAIKAGLSPDYQIIVDEEETKRKSITIKKFFRKFKKNDWEKYSLFATSNRTIKDNIVSCFNELTVNVNHLDKSQIFFYNVKETIEELVDKKEKATYNLAEIIYELYYENEQLIIDRDIADKEDAERRGKGFNETVKADYKDLFKDFSERFPTFELFLAEFKNYKITIPFNKPRIKKIFTNGDEINKNLDEINAEIKQVDSSISAYASNMYLNDAYRLYKLYLEDCDKDISHLTNNDLIYHTFVLLRDHTDVVIKLQSKIKHLYIDEYQDTDSVQYKIAKFIAGDREDCLYLVGDPKQSIYRFRGAEPDVFFDTKKMFENDKNHYKYDIYSLNINFRSNNKILEWVNSKYSDSGENIRLVSDIGYAYSEMLYADKNYIDPKDINDDNLIGFYSYDSSSPDSIARLVRYLKENKKLRHVYKREENGEEVFYSEYEPIKYSDIMILFQGHKKMPPYISELSKANIPTRVFGSIDFSETFALRAFVNLFDVLNTNSNSNLAIAEAVFQVIYPSRYDGKTLSASHQTTLDLINQLRNETRRMSSYGKAIYLIEHLDLLIEENSEAHYFEINNYVSKLYQMVEEVFSKGFINGSEITEEFRKYLDKAVERESSIEKDTDSVMMINLHKAKGLEKPIVIWVSVNRKNNSDKSSTFYKGKFYYGPLVKYVLDIDPSQSSLGLIDKEDEFEKARLEYVAVTRPGEAFIFAQSAEFKAGLFNNAERKYKHMELPRINVYFEDDEENSNDKYDDVYSSQEHAYQKGTTSEISIISPSSLENNTSLTRQRLREEASELEETKRPKSNNVGTILNRSLELIIKNKVSPEAATELAINENLDVVDDMDILKPFILTCSKAYLEFFNKQGYNTYDAYPEFTFSYLNKENVINNGSIDLLLVKGDEFIVIDYKSDEAEYIKDDSVFEETLKEKYEPQLLSYEKVVQDLFKTNKAVQKIIIYFRRYNFDQQNVEVKEYRLK